MGKLTVFDIKSQKGPCRLSDGEGLFFEITQSKLKRWLYRYKIKGKQGVYILGRFPDVSLSEARSFHRVARAQVRQGLNPAQIRREEKAENIQKQQEAQAKRENKFKEVAIQWYQLAALGKHKANAKPWSEKHRKTVLSSLERDVFPHIGRLPIEDIEPHNLMPIIDTMTARGVYDNTRKTIQRISLIFNFAIIKRKCRYNPATSLQGLLPSNEVNHHPAVFDKDLGQLMKDITACRRMHISTKLALRFTAYTALRSGEVRLATWDEVDWDSKELHITPERMKRGRAHIVPLSPQAIATLETAGTLWGRKGLIFPSPRSNEKPLSDNTLSKAFRNLGYQGKAVVHGLRASFSTMAREHTEFEKEVIETSIAHIVADKTEAAYNHSQYLAKRHKLMQWWGNKLQVLEHGADIIQ